MSWAERERERLLSKGARHPPTLLRHQSHHGKCSLAGTPIHNLFFLFLFLLLRSKKRKVSEHDGVAAVACRHRAHKCTQNEYINAKWMANVDALRAFHSTTTTTATKKAKNGAENFRLFYGIWHLKFAIKSVVRFLFFSLAAATAYFVVYRVPCACTRHTYIDVEWKASRSCGFVAHSVSPVSLSFSSTSSPTHPLAVNSIYFCVFIQKYFVRT